MHTKGQCKLYKLIVNRANTELYIMNSENIWETVQKATTDAEMVALISTLNFSTLKPLVSDGSTTQYLTGIGELIYAQPTRQDQQD